MKVQDHLNSLRNCMGDAVQEDVKAAERLMRDAKNSKTVGVRMGCAGVLHGERCFQLQFWRPVPAFSSFLPTPKGALKGQSDMDPCGPPSAPLAAQRGAWSHRPPPGAESPGDESPGGQVPFKVIATHSPFFLLPPRLTEGRLPLSPDRSFSPGRVCPRGVTWFWLSCWGHTLIDDCSEWGDPGAQSGGPEVQASDLSRWSPRWASVS